MNKARYAEIISRRLPALRQRALQRADGNSKDADVLVEQSQSEIVKKLDRVRDERHWWRWSVLIINIRRSDGE